MHLVPHPAARRRAGDPPPLPTLPADHAGLGQTLRLRRRFEPTVSTWRVLVRQGKWALATARLGVRVAQDRLAGRNSRRDLGVRLREMFEQMGATAIKIGQQMAVRVDFLPFEICDELSGLTDAVEPMPLDVAVARIEAAIGGPLDLAFERFDRDPIGAASIATVYKAKLHGGPEVAVKVRRPDVGAAFAADLTALDWGTRAMEALAVVRPGFFRHLRAEIRGILFDELDLRLEADYQTLFRALTKRDRLRWLSAPKVFPTLSNAEVLVTRFVDGLTLTEVMRIAETGDAAALRALASHDIDPRVVGERLAQVLFWARFETPMFHADPHPGNIFVQPGNQLVLIDFGSCAQSSRLQASAALEMSRRLEMDDLWGAAQTTLTAVQPLPALDIEAFKRAAEETIWDFHLRSQSKDAEWWERTGAFVWMRFAESARDLEVPVNLDTLRLMRAMLLYDTLACRLNPQLSASKTYRAWTRAARRRARRRVAYQDARQIRRKLQVQANEMVEIGQRGAHWASHMTRVLPVKFTAALGKGSYVATLLLRGARWVCIAAVAGLVLRLAQRSGGGATPLGLSSIATHPVFIAVAVTTALVTLQRIRARLDEVDPVS